jgi:hypothetical protein
MRRGDRLIHMQTSETTEECGRITGFYAVASLKAVLICSSIESYIAERIQQRFEKRSTCSKSSSFLRSN